MTGISARGQQGHNDTALRPDSHFVGPISRLVSQYRPYFGRENHDIFPPMCPQPDIYFATAPNSDPLNNLSKSKFLRSFFLEPIYPALHYFTCTTPSQKFECLVFRFTWLLCTRRSKFGFIKVSSGCELTGKKV